MATDTKKGRKRKERKGRKVRAAEIPSYALADDDNDEEDDDATHVSLSSETTEKKRKENDAEESAASTQTMEDANVRRYYKPWELLVMYACVFAALPFASAETVTKLVSDEIYIPFEQSVQRATNKKGAWTIKTIGSSSADVAAEIAFDDTNLSISQIPTTSIVLALRECMFAYFPRQLSFYGSPAQDVIFSHPSAVVSLTMDGEAIASCKLLRVMLKHCGFVRRRARFTLPLICTEQNDAWTTKAEDHLPKAIVKAEPAWFAIRYAHQHGYWNVNEDGTFEDYSKTNYNSSSISSTTTATPATSSSGIPLSSSNSQAATYVTIGPADIDFWPLCYNLMRVINKTKGCDKKEKKTEEEEKKKGYSTSSMAAGTEYLANKIRKMALETRPPDKVANDATVISYVAMIERQMMQYTGAVHYKNRYITALIDAAEDAAFAAASTTAADLRTRQVYSLAVLQTTNQSALPRKVLDIVEQTKRESVAAAGDRLEIAVGLRDIYKHGGNGADLSHWRALIRKVCKRFGPRMSADAQTRDLVFFCDIVSDVEEACSRDVEEAKRMRKMVAPKLMACLSLLFVRWFPFAGMFFDDDGVTIDVAATAAFVIVCVKKLNLFAF